MRSYVFAVNVCEMVNSENDWVSSPSAVIHEYVEAVEAVTGETIPYCPYYPWPVDIDSVNVVARNPYQAAARGYYLVIGRRRAECLASLNAPKVCILFERCLRWMARYFKTSWVWTRHGRCFVLNNSVQTFHIRTRRIRLSRARQARLQAKLEARQRRRYHLMTRTCAN